MDETNRTSFDRPKLTVNAARHSPRLWINILNSFDFACEQQDLESAAMLLSLLENMVTLRIFPSETNRRKSLEMLVMAYERLWHLRCSARSPRFANLA